MPEVVRDGERDLWSALAKLQDALTTLGPGVDDETHERAVRMTDDLQRGRTVRPDIPRGRCLAERNATALRLGQDDVLAQESHVTARLRPDGAGRRHAPG